MRRKGRFALCVVLAGLLAAQAWLYFAARPVSRPELLLVVPKLDAVPIALETLERVSQNRFLATYTVSERATAQALQTSYPVDVVGTNAAYRELLGYPLLAGSFFTESACESHARHAVLNETAALQLFGTVQIVGLGLRVRGEQWQVVGVIADEDRERARLYIPRTQVDGDVESLFALLDERVEQAEVLSALQELGIYGQTHAFWNLGQVRAAFGGRLNAALQLALCALLVLTLRLLVRGLRRDAAYLREHMERSYPQELLRDWRCARTLLRLVLVPFVCAALFGCVRRVLEQALVWGDALAGFWRADVSAHGAPVLALWRMHRWGVLLFAGFVAALSLSVGACWHACGDKTRVGASHSESHRRLRGCANGPNGEDL